MFLWRKALVLLAFFITWCMWSSSLVYCICLHQHILLISLPPRYVTMDGLWLLVHVIRGTKHFWGWNSLSAGLFSSLGGYPDLFGATASSRVFMRLYGTQPLAISLNDDPLIMWQGRSLMYRMKRVGPRTLLWGSQDFTRTLSDLPLSSITVCSIR